MRPAYPFRRSDVAVTDAPAAAGPFPVLAWSHGHQAIPDAASDLMEHFASHGWLVLSPTHVDNTTLDGPDRVTSIYYLRPHDVSRSLDAMEDLPSDHPLSNLVGSPKVISGHSFGGYTAYAIAGASYTDMRTDRCAAEEISSAFCSELDAESDALFEAGFEDDRFDAIIAMASGDSTLFGDGIADVDIPLLQMVAEGDGNPPGDASGDLYWQNTEWCRRPARQHARRRAQQLHRHVRVGGAAMQRDARRRRSHGVVPDLRARVDARDRCKTTWRSPSSWPATRCFHRWK